MSTISELFVKMELGSVAQNEAIIANFETIIANQKDAYNCLQARLEELAKSIGCPDDTDIVFAVDRSKGIGANEPFVEDWLVETINELSPSPNAVNAAIYTFPQDNSDGSTLGNVVENHNLSSSGVALRVAAGNYSIENIVSDGRRPVDQAINAANIELTANGRADSRKVIVLMLTGPSNFSSGYGTVATSPTAAANNARAAGYEVYVVSVGAGNPAEEAAIAGGADRVFHVATYEELIYTADNIRSAICDTSETYVDCLPEEPTLAEIPSLEICGTTTTCYDELF